MKITGIGKETSENIRSQIESLIQPWQYKNSDIHIVNVDSVLSDVETNWNQDIRFRHGFNINDDKSLNVPTMFVQINGIYEDKKQYEKFINDMDTKETYHVKNMPIFEKDSDWYHSYTDTIKSILAFDKEDDELPDTCTIDFVPGTFKKLHTSVQKMICRKLEAFVDKYLDGMPYEDQKDILYRIISLNDDILNLLQNFDYPFKNPKIMVEDMKGQTFEEGDKYVLIFLYSLGFDILIFSPKGQEFLPNYPINTITLDRYLATNEDTYDYRDDKVIEKEKKDKVKQEKKKQWNFKRKKIFSDIIAAVIVIAFIALIIGVVGFLVYIASLPEDMEKTTNDMTWYNNQITMYADQNETPAYQYANTESEILKILPEGEEVTVVEFNDTWYKVLITGSNYYIPEEYLREKLYDIDMENFVMTIIAGGNVSAYKYPDIDSEVVFSYKENDKIKALGYTNDWYMVEKSSDIGFINRDELTVQDKEDTETETTSTPETEETGETMTDGEITENTEDITLGDLILVALLILIILLLVFFFISLLTA